MPASTFGLFFLLILTAIVRSATFALKYLNNNTLYYNSFNKKQKNFIKLIKIINKNKNK